MTPNSIPVPRRSRDRGSILPLALVATVVLGAVVAATATYATSTLRYGQAAEARAMRVSAANGALDDTLEKLRIGGETLCGNFDSISRDFTGEINGLRPTITCGSTTSLLDGGQGWALAVTGENASGDIIQFGNSDKLPIDGPVFVDDPNRLSIGQGSSGNKQVVLGPSVATATHDVYYPCATPGGSSAPAYELDDPVVDVIAAHSYCVNRSWEDIFLPGPSEVLPGPAPDPPYRDIGACRVFWPGAYDNDASTPAPPMVLGPSNYFLSGTYLFSGLGDIGHGQFLTFGRADISGYPGGSVGSACLPADVGSCTTAPNVAPDPATWTLAVHAFCNDNMTGAVVYLDGNTTFDMAKKDGGLDISGADVDGVSVSLQSRCAAASCGRPIIEKTGAGGGNDPLNFSTFGLVWAPYDSVGMEQIPASSGLGFQGGLVIGSIAMNMSGGGVIIRVAGGTVPVQLMVQAKAMDERGSNTVRAVVDYVGPPEPQLAVLSRRVLDGS